MKRLRQLDEENGKLKRIVADLSLDKPMLQDVGLKKALRPARKRELVDVHRLYRELDLQLRNKTPKRRVNAKLREDRADACQINETWAMDFVHDQLATGRKIRVLTIVDIFSRFLRSRS